MWDCEGWQGREKDCEREGGVDGGIENIVDMRTINFTISVSIRPS